jgi:hypothetical protein
MLLAGLILTGMAFAAADSLPTPPRSRESQQRLADRKVRQQLAKDYVTARRRILSGYLSGLEKLAAWLTEQKAKTEAEAVLAELAKEGPENTQWAKLKADAETIAAPQALADAQKGDYEKRLSAARRAGASGLVQLARTCNAAGLVNYAYDLLQDVLLISPDDVTARAAMGYVKSGQEWLPTFVAMQQRSGLCYLPHIGWVPKQASERIGKGEWFEAGRWLKLADADQLHANVDTPWIIETENFTLKSTCNRKQAIAISEKLEAIRQCCYRQFLDFFLRGSDKRGAQLLFNIASTRKLEVNYYATQADYATVVQRSKPGGNTELLLNSVGFYSPAQHASFFYHLDWGNDENLTIMQHEVTHQVLGEYARGRVDTPIWLVEGLAETTGYARPDARGWLMIPSGRKHPDVRQAAKWLAESKLQPINVLLGLTDEAFHEEPNRGRNYKWSGAFSRFLLEFEDGIYATDFLEYAYDRYTGRAKTPLTDYLGMPAKALNEAFREYLEK